MLTNKFSIKDYHERINQTLDLLVNHEKFPAARIQNAMNYSLFSGGKRIRPLLVYLCGEIIDVDCVNLDIIAASIELTHCYSLIHDDLPAMDNDDFRRGKPSCHRAFDEATAILVGDGLQAFAIEILLRNLPKTLPSQSVIAITCELVNACGPSGMVSGQSLDLSELTNKNITIPELCNIHQLKTGKLMQACINMILHAGTPKPSAAHALKKFAEHLGLVFQMQDDYLDLHDQNFNIGKNRSSDLVNQKITFATLYTKDELLENITYHFEKAKQQLNYFGERANLLINFINSIQQRNI